MRRRIRQFLAANESPTSEDLALATAHLDGPLLELFGNQHPRDIVHAAATARWLMERGHDDPDLIAAALLHDIGKGPQRRVDRVGWVLASAIRSAESLARADSRFAWRRAFARSAEHSESGARMLAEAGADPRVIALTRLHHAPPRGDRMLALLQQADAEN